MANGSKREPTGGGSTANLPRAESLAPERAEFDKMFGPDLDRPAGSQGVGAGAFPLALFRFLGLAVLLAAGFVQPLAAQERVALVVGNSAYQHIAELRNPGNDAEDLSARLESLGFEVFGGTDLDRRALVEALIRFGRAAEKAEVALFFYAGHGLQVNGQNYLVPIDAMVEFESEIDLSLVSLSGVMQQLERGSRTNIVFLDACRDNPFAKELSRTMGNRSATALNKGLGRIQSGSGTFIAFATQPDAVAADGAGRNSPFTTALLTHIGAPGQSISDMMIEVRNDVIATTNGAQVPWDSSSLTGRFSFAPETVAMAPANEAPGFGDDREGRLRPGSGGRKLRRIRGLSAALPQFLLCRTREGEGDHGLRRAFVATARQCAGGHGDALACQGRRLRNRAVRGRLLRKLGAGADQGQPLRPRHDVRRHA